MPQQSSRTPRTAVVTGASSGIGLVVARELARQGWRVIAHGRNPERSKAALSQINRAAVPGEQVAFVQADLSVMAEVRRAANEIAALTDCVDVLVNNAGAVIKERQITPDGYEATFAGNHLGPFLLTKLLMPLLRVAALTNGQAQVITTTSRAHTMVRDMAWDNLQLAKGYRPWQAYAQSKLANILFTRELADREADSGIIASAVHPGIVDTNFPSGGGMLTKAGWLLMKPFTKTPEQGADTILWLAIDGPKGESGNYYAKRRPASTSKAAQSAKGARQLWDISDKLTARD